MDDISCPICLEVFNDPVLLSCFHNVCRACAGSLLRHAGSSGVIACPTCRQPTACSSADDLRTNIALRNVIDKLVTKTGASPQGSSSRGGASSSTFAVMPSASSSSAASEPKDKEKEALLSPRKGKNPVSRDPAPSPGSSQAGSSSHQYQPAPSRAESDIFSDQSDADAAWVPDDMVHQCTQCAKRFTLFRRRHHCRFCGNIFCDECSRHTFKFDSYASAKPQRVCDSCYDVLTDGGRLEEKSGQASQDSPLKKKKGLQLSEDALTDILWVRLQSVWASVEAHSLPPKTSADTRIATDLEDLDEHVLTVPVLCERYGGQQHCMGLNPLEVQKRQSEFGPNQLRQEQEKTTKCFCFDRTFPPQQEDWWKTARARLQMASSVRVVRQGQHTTCVEEDIAVGDVLHLLPGDRVVADARVIVCNEGSRAESKLLTGESKSYKVYERAQAVEVDQARNVLFNGSHLLQGEAYAIVFATGLNSFLGCHWQPTQRAFKGTRKEKSVFRDLCEHNLMLPHSVEPLRIIPRITTVVISLVTPHESGKATTAFQGAVQGIRGCLDLGVKVVVVLPLQPTVESRKGMPDWMEQSIWEYNNLLSTQQRTSQALQGQQQEIVKLCKAFGKHVPIIPPDQAYSSYATSQFDQREQLTVLAGTQLHTSFLLKILHSYGERALFVGGGVNERPAIDSADVGITKLTATAFAKTAASGTLLGDVSALPAAIRLIREELSGKK